MIIDMLWRDGVLVPQVSQKGEATAHLGIRLKLIDKLVRPIHCSVVALFATKVPLEVNMIAPDVREHVTRHIAAPVGTMSNISEIVSRVVEGGREMPSCILNLRETCFRLQKTNALDQALCVLLEAAPHWALVVDLAAAIFNGSTDHFLGVRSRLNSLLNQLSDWQGNAMASSAPERQKEPRDNHPHHTEFSGVSGKGSLSRNTQYKKNCS
mmetsp:Transcript_2531/g.4761  ORF Transcript_2531/g.4761 Transcript_2531/m.4761 type:complete len:211 (-) Transcript_2531:18-650(-)